MKKLNNKGFLLVETIVVATFTLTVLIALFLQFKNLLVSYNSSYNYNTVEGVYNLNTVKNYVMQYQDSANSLNKQLKNSEKPYLVLYNGSCSEQLGLGGLTYCDALMTEGNFKTVIFSSSNPTKIKDYLKSNEDINISEEMKNLIKRLDKVDNQNRLIAEFNDGTLATIVFGVDNDTKPAEPKPEEPTKFTGTIYSKEILTDTNNWTDEDWKNNSIYPGNSIEKIKGYTTEDKSTFGNYYLKHIIINDQVESNEVCFVTETEHCMKSNDFENSKALLQSQQEWFESNGGGCGFDDSIAYCLGGSFSNIGANSKGDVSVDNGINVCVVDYSGTADCYKL